MKRAAAFSWAMILACGLAVQPAPAGADDGTRRAVAKVNGKVLFMDQLDPILKAQKKQMPNRGPVRTEAQETAQKRALEQLIDVELITQQARKLEVPDLDAKVEARLASLRHAQPAFFAEKPEAEIRSLVADEFRVEAYLEKQGVAEPAVSEEELRAFYDKGQGEFRREESVHLRHLTIQLAEDAAGPRTSARDLLTRVRQEILAGKDFESAAAEALHDPQGFQGDLGLLTRSDMPAEIANAAFALDPGALSEVIDTPRGVHLVEVLARKPAGIVPYEEVRDFIRKYLQEGRSRQAYQNLVQGLRRQALIEIVPEPG